MSSKRNKVKEDFEMPVTPEEAAKVNSAKEKEAISRALQVIDERLKARYVKGGSVSISKQSIIGRKVLGYQPYYRRVEKEIKRVYDAAGWSIKEETSSDIREGSSCAEWVFTATIPGVPKPDNLQPQFRNRRPEDPPY